MRERSAVSGQWSAVLLISALVVPLMSAGVRAQDLFTYHGDPIPASVESMYIKGLNYLTKTQTSSGAWQDTYGSNAGVVGLAVLAMLAHGDDPNSGPYSQSIKRALDYLLKTSQQENGYMGSSMYNHGFATLALAESYGSVDDPRLGPALKKAVALILTSQSNNGIGAWRYSPTSQDADSTVSGAQMVALFAARNAGIGVPDKSIKTGLRFFRQCQGGDGGIGYTSAGSGSPPRTAIGALVFALAKQKDQQEFKSAFRFLQQTGFQSGSYSYYYVYYASQAYFHADMTEWDSWNKQNITRLSAAQGANGSWTGSHGGVFSTSTALLSLAVNYRFLPIYER